MPPELGEAIQVVEDETQIDTLAVRVSVTPKLTMGSKFHGSHHSALSLDGPSPASKFGRGGSPQIADALHARDDQITATRSPSAGR